MIPHPPFTPPTSPQSGNVIFFVLLAIVLIGMVTVAVRGTTDNTNIDRESMILKISKTREYVNELERGLRFIMHDGASEIEIRFAHPDAPAQYGTITDTPTRQIFGAQGGNVSYRLPDPAISNADNWEFYGQTHIPGIGSDRAELIAVLPQVTLEFCQKINEINGFDPAIQPEDNVGTCLGGVAANRFGPSSGFASSSIDTVNAASFTAQPAMQGCVACGSDFYFYHVLLAR